MTAEDLAVVLLPGLDGTGLLFRPLIEAAPPGVLPVVVDYPVSSHGGMAALASVVRDQQPDRPWILVAESFSGPLAISIAANDPLALRGLVLVATAARWRHLRWLTWLPLTALLRLRLPAHLLRWLVLGRGASEDLLALTRLAIDRVDSRVLASRLRDLSRVDATQDLRRVSVPVLYLEASEDRLVHHRERTSVLDSPIRVDHRVVPGPHFLLQAQPGPCWQNILDFCHSQGAGGPTRETDSAAPSFYPPV